MKFRTSHFALALAGAALATGSVAVAGQTKMVGGAAMYPTKDIVDNAVNSKDHTTLVAAVKAAGLVDTLKSPGPFTVFAPTNAAFAKLPAGTVDTLLKPENKGTLTAVLTYHVVPGKMMAADIAAKAGPVIAVVATILVTIGLDLEDRGVNLVGAIPQGLPPFALPSTDLGLIGQLWVPALLISIIGFVESVSVAQTLAAKRRQRIAPNQELIGLGATNIASAFSGGYPVTGGFARSVVNFDAGAETPAAGAYTAVGIALAGLFLTPLLYSLPIATLAATIIVAVLSLVDLKTPGQLWNYSKADFAAHIATIAITLLAGVELGVIAGVGVGLLLYLWRASRPHAAIVGRVPETEHFRNMDRHKVFTVPHVLSIRIDESLTYLNARWLEEYVLEEIADRPDVRHLILMCSAVNEIDASGLESLEAINHRMIDAGIGLHLSEVKGPVMDRLKRTHFIDDLNGQVFLSQNRAFRELSANGGPPAEPIGDAARGMI